ncbi:sirohydrochlorin chelatase [Enterococcus termitis]|uniref:Cobalamin biosynthesis protein CbiX n=1 Tax=Enterococcus termitis TaxID=332950 RepID=A0A1E5G8U9_9ENTE|nr:sirohydrochlorin chelatase [Enterococcus termitis]OEG09143.1 hypothetical protein BCR25_11270 [Enterococcus termitis]OJG98600.1 hypothetical protein RV18_GL003023 [Enterococcus termitis]
MIGILYVFHGSQKKEKNQAAMNFIQQLQQRLEPKRYQKTAFLENHPDTITRIAEEMISNGVDQLIIVPVLLFAAKHALVDIPAELEVVKKNHPTVQIIQTETFGSKTGSRAVLLERFKTVAADYPHKQLTGFLMAHGTKQTDEPQQALLEIAAEIQQQVDFPVTAVSLKGKEDYVEIINDGLSKDKQPVIVPFFLFDGHLITIMNTKLAEAFPEIDFIVTPTLEFDPRILPDIEAIVNEAVACIQ